MGGNTREGLRPLPPVTPTPFHELRFIVGRLHVSATPLLVETDIRQRAEDKLSKLATDRAVRYALAAHRHNGNLYRRVMGGTI